MDCPHCQKPLPALECPACQRPALAGAAFCHHCGQALPAPEGQPPLLLTCDSCGRKALPMATSYCPDCGQPLAGPAPGEDFDPSQRLACADGNCIGIIGPDGKCSECGKPHPGHQHDHQS